MTLSPLPRDESGQVQHAALVAHRPEIERRFRAGLVGIPASLPVVRVAGDEVAPRGVTGRAMTKAAIAYARRWQHQTLVLSDARTSLISGGAIKHSARNAAFALQGQHMARLDDVVRLAVHVATEPPEPGSPPQLASVVKYLAFLQVSDGPLYLVQVTHMDFGRDVVRFYESRVWQTRAPD